MNQLARRGIRRRVDAMRERERLARAAGGERPERDRGDKNRGGRGEREAKTLELFFETRKDGGADADDLPVDDACAELSAMAACWERDQASLSDEDIRGGSIYDDRKEGSSDEDDRKPPAAAGLPPGQHGHGYRHGGSARKLPPPLYRPDRRAGGDDDLHMHDSERLLQSLQKLKDEDEASRSRAAKQIWGEGDLYVPDEAGEGADEPFPSSSDYDEPTQAPLKSPLYVPPKAPFSYPFVSKTSMASMNARLDDSTKHFASLGIADVHDSRNNKSRVEMDRIGSADSFSVEAMDHWPGKGSGAQAAAEAAVPEDNVDLSSIPSPPQTPFSCPVSGRERPPRSVASQQNRRGEGKASTSSTHSAGTTAIHTIVHTQDQDQHPEAARPAPAPRPGDTPALAMDDDDGELEEDGHHDDDDDDDGGMGGDEDDGGMDGDEEFHPDGLQAGDVQVHLALDELLGIRGPIHLLLRNVIWLLVFNVFYITFFFAIPYAIGHLMAARIDKAKWFRAMLLAVPEKLQLLAGRVSEFSSSGDGTLQLVDIPIIVLGYLSVFVVIFTIDTIISWIHRRSSGHFLELVVEVLGMLSSVIKVGCLLFLRIFILPVLLGGSILYVANLLLQKTLDEWLAFAQSNIVGSCAMAWAIGISYMLTVTLSVLQLREVLHPDILARYIRPQEAHLDLLHSLMNESPILHLRRICVSFAVYALLLVIFFYVPVALVHLATGHGSWGLSFCYFLPQIQIPLELALGHITFLSVLEKKKNVIGRLQHKWFCYMAGRLGITRYILPLPMKRSESRTVPPAAELINGQHVLKDSSGLPIVGRPLHRPPPNWDARLIVRQHTENVSFCMSPIFQT